LTPGVYARIHPDDLAGMKAAEEAHLRADTPFFFVEFRMRHKDGHYIWVESRGMVVERTPDGEPRRIIGTHTDITRRKALDASLQAAKVAAEEASASKSAFLANMSHEIRTPLNGIIGMAHLLRLSGLSDEQSERLGRLEHSAAHLLEVLNAVLDLSKIEAGKVVLEERPLRLETVVANVSSMVEESAKRKDLRLNTDVDVFPRNLLGDATRLKQSLLNYAGNAVKFTEHGSITLRAKLLREDDDCVQVRFEVADTGPGIEPAVLSRLFSSFEQGDRATTRTSGGTGLGLAITRRLAELMGGEAGAESNPGQGSRFWFTARCRKAATPVEPKAKAAVPDAKAALRLGHAGARVLLAEDNEINREVAVAILELAGLVVDCAEDGEQAVAKVGDGGYALVLMDMQMPRMDGLEATRKIRKRWPSASLPIIAMTANAFTEDRVRCQEAGMDDFLSKPVDPNQLYALLLNWLDKSRAADRP